MTENNKKNTTNIKYIIGLVAAILIGITFIVSGTGKVLGIEETPAQVVDFISDIIPEIILTPGIIYFLYQILIPHIVPWMELILGILLVAGFAPRLISIFCLPLILTFLCTNIWSIIKGGYATCASCFGIWEQFFGSLTPVQSLIYDIILLLLAILVIFMYSGSILSSSQYLTNSAKKYWSLLKKKLGKWFLNFSKYYSYIKQTIGKHRGVAIAIITVLVFITLIITASTMRSTDELEIVQDTVISGITISNISDNSAVVTWQTEQPSTSYIFLYNSNGEFFREITDIKPVMEHRITLGDLTEETEYYFEVTTNNEVSPEVVLTNSNYFKTLPLEIIPLEISNIMVEKKTESSALLTWATNKLAISFIQYWSDNAAEQPIKLESGLITKYHSFYLTGLSENKIYSLQIVVTEEKDEEKKLFLNNYFSLLSGPKEAMYAPDFTLNTLDGNPVTLSDYRGKTVLLDFWIWTCSACRTKLPMVQHVYDSVPSDEITILSIHYRGRAAIIKNFASSIKITLPILLDETGEITDLYQATGFPTVFLIDRSGIVRTSDVQFNNVEELQTAISNIAK